MKNCCEKQISFYPFPLKNKEKRNKKEKSFTILNLTYIW
jgi:hypothetical protein